MGDIPLSMKLLVTLHNLYAYNHMTKKSDEFAQTLQMNMNKVDQILEKHVAICSKLHSAKGNK
jgi:hypothetical protein